MAMVLSSGSIQISWSVSDDGGNPNLLYSLTQWTNRNTSQVVLLSNSVSGDGQYLVDRLMPNTSYRFSVVAHSDSGDSPHGWSILVITNPCKYMYIICIIFIEAIRTYIHTYIQYVHAYDYQYHLYKAIHTCLTLY